MFKKLMCVLISFIVVFYSFQIEMNALTTINDTLGAGYEHSLYIDGNGDLWAWGSNMNGELGLGHLNYQTIPQFVMSNVKYVEAGHQSSFAIKNNGDLWGWGNNYSGNLSVGKLNNPSPLFIMSNVRSVSSGYTHTLAIKEDGNLWGWGYNGYGELGSLNINNLVSPKLISEDVKFALAGYHTTFIIKNDNSLWVLGRNSYGQLCTGNKTNVNEPTLILNDVMDVSYTGDSNFLYNSNHTSYILMNDRTLWACGENEYITDINDPSYEYMSPVKILDDVIDIDSGALHNVALKSNGDVYTWGAPTYHINDDGLLGREENRNGIGFVIGDVKEIEAGRLYTLIVKKDGTLWGWGMPLGIDYNFSTSIIQLPHQINKPQPKIKTTNYISNETGYTIKVKDSLGNIISNAEITIEGTARSVVEIDVYGYTKDDGIINFSNWDKRVSNNQSYTIRVEKEGYKTSRFVKVIKFGSAFTLTVPPDDGKSYVSSVVGSYKGKDIDLLTDTMYFKSDKDKTTPGDNNVKAFEIQAYFTNNSNIRNYELLQGGEVIASNPSGYFFFEVLTGTVSNEYAYQGAERITKIKAGQKLYLRYKDTNGKYSNNIELGLKVSEPKYIGFTDTKYNFEIGREIVVNVPSGVPIIGDTEFRMGFPKYYQSPITIGVDLDGKVRVAYNVICKKTGDSPCDPDWDKTFEEFEKLASDVFKGLESEKKSFSAGKTTLKAELIGYGEGYINESGNLSVNLGIIVKINQKGSYTYQMLFFSVPVYVNVGAKIGLTGTFQGNLRYSNGKFSIKCDMCELKPELGLNLDAGAGIYDALSVGGSGRATVTFTNRWLENYTNISLKGEMYLVAQAFILKAEKKIKSGTWTLYDSYASQSSSIGDMRTLEEVFYDTSSYTPIPRDYLNYSDIGMSTQEFDVNGLNAVTVKEAVFPNAQPKLAQVNGVSYLFWLEDNPNRSDANRTMLVYSSSSDQITWSEPTSIIQNELSESLEAQSADFNYDVNVRGSVIDIVWQKANQVFLETIGLDDIARSNEVYYTQLNTVDQTIMPLTRITNDLTSDQLVRVKTLESNGSIAWVSNGMEEGFFGLNNSYRVNYASLDNLSSVQSILVSGIVSELEIVPLNGRLTVFYTLDQDRDLNTSTDREIWYIDENHQAIQYTSNVSLESNLKTIKLNGQTGLSWHTEGNVYYTFDLTTIQTIFNPEVESIDTDHYSIIEGNSDKIHLVWEKTNENRESVSTMIYAKEYDGVNWTTSYPLVETASELTSELSGYYIDDTLVLGYLNTRNVDTEMPISSVKVVRSEPSPDLSLINVSYLPELAHEGEALPLSFTVKNEGADAISTFKIYLNDTLLEERTDVLISSGETKVFDVNSYVIPSDFSTVQTQTLRLEVVDEVDVLDNSFNLTVGQAELSVETDRQFIDEKEYASIIIKNDSLINQDVVLTLTNPENPGTILYQETIPNLDNTVIHTIILGLDELKIPELSNAIDFTISSVNEEKNLLNNVSTLVLERKLEAFSGYTISGLTKYYQGDKVVENTQIKLLSVESVNTTSGSDGNYLINGLEMGEYQVEVNKTDGSNGISAYDAALALQYSVGLISLDENQQIAADVTNNQSVTAFDASQILMKSVGLIPDVYPDSQKLWVFKENGSLLNVTQNNYEYHLIGILLGDVSGNWQPSVE